ncbi:MAG: DUF3368 domain-containing protein [Gammaproteobacteria bacterium]|nr:DUF3368 domain-containing protein [Gammaproteobacteria bacterium]
MRVLISDANVIIDMEDCGLTQVMFSLPYQFSVPDILYFDELEDGHPNLLDQGLNILELSQNTLVHSMDLNRRYKQPGRYDCLALAAALQEACTLLTGDKSLRNAARKEKVEVKGTIWLVEEMFNHRLIDKQQVITAFDDMKEAGSRLPWNEVSKLLKRI